MILEEFHGHMVTKSFLLFFFLNNCSKLVKGIVCTKNIKHKRMTSQYRNTQLLLLGGALEYERVPNQLASLDTLLQQVRFFGLYFISFSFKYTSIALNFSYVSGEGSSEDGYFKNRGPSS